MALAGLRWSSSADGEVLGGEHLGMPRAGVAPSAEDADFAETRIKKFPLEDDRLPCTGDSRKPTVRRRILRYGHRFL